MILKAARAFRRGKLLLLLFGLAGCAAPPPLVDLSEGRPNVILIALDTFRADHLGCYGGQRAQTPNIDALAAESILFERCSSNAPWTLPSFGTLFTGRLPSAHRAVGGGSKRLSSQLPTMAEIFTAHGYATLGFVAVDWLGTGFGLDRGFERQYPDFDGRVTGRYDRQLPQIFHFLGNRPVEPFFILSHFYDAHAPYDPPSPYDRMYYEGDPYDPAKHSMEPLYLGSNRIQRQVKARYAWLEGVTDLEYPTAQYAAGITHVDAGVGKLLDLLRSNGQLDRSVVILVSDHGEHLTEHSIYFTHRFPYEECLHVPLMIRLPGARGAGRRIASEVSLVDLLPTVLELLDIPRPEILDGSSLLPLMRGKKLHKQRIHFAEYGASPRNHVRAAWDADFRLIDFSVGDERWLELYDRQMDRAEVVNVASEHPAERDRLLAALRRQFGSDAILAGELPDSSHIRLDPAIEERLRALGYVD
jgi:arylsulfatase A-like enzyme